MNHTALNSRVIVRSLVHSQRLATQATPNAAPSSSQTQAPPSSRLKVEKNHNNHSEEAKATTTGEEDPSKSTHFKITLYRSAIGLPKRYKDTLDSLGIRRRGQTVFQMHSGTVAGKILRLKEIVKVENVPTSEVKTKSQLRQERRAVRGYYVKQKFQGSANSGSSTSWMDGL